jgi:hypothetical protein
MAQASHAPRSDLVPTVVTVTLTNEILDDKILEAFDAQVPGLLVNWCRRRLEVKSMMEKKG